MKKCPHCNNEFNFEKPKQFGAHVVNCSFNPKKKERLKNISLNLKGRPKTKKLCDKCGKMIANSNLDRHMKKCGSNKRQIITVQEEWKTNTGKYKCPYCESLFSKKGIGSHIFYQHTADGYDNKKKKFSDETIKSKMGWSRGLTTETDERVRKASEQQKELYATGQIISHWKDKNLSAEHKSKLSLAQTKVLNEFEITSNFKHIKYYKCKNLLGEEFNMRGLYEVKLSEWLNLNKIVWTRGMTLNYIQDGVERLYSPDFYLPEHNLYLETKGYYPECDQIKMKLVLEQNNINLRIIFRETINKLSNIQSISELF